jgi:hypothetical protein
MKVDADRQRLGGIEPDQDLRAKMGVVADDGRPGNGEPFGLHSPDFPGARDWFGLAFEFSKASEDAERKLAGRGLRDDLVLLRLGFET